MVDSFAVLNAMRGVQEDYVVDAMNFLGYMENEPEQHNHRKILCFLLVAAIITTLFSVTAYALGWFGLRQRVMQTDKLYYAQESSTEQSGWMTFNGYSDSDELKASVEWAAAQWQAGNTMTDVNPTDWPESMGEYIDIAQIYGAFNQEQLDELLRIRDKYHLKLHTKMVTPITNAEFLEVVGLSPFIRSADPSLDWACKYVFEDGSFRLEGNTDLNGKQVTFGLSRNRSGTLAVGYFFVQGLDDYDEWQISQDSFGINLALRQTEADSKAFEFVDSEKWFFTINLSTYDGSLLTKEDVESFAKLFDYGLLNEECGTTLTIASSAAKNVQAKQGLLTLAEYIQTPEYLAGSSFHHVYCDYYDTTLQQPNYIAGQYAEYYYSPFPTGVEVLDHKLEELQKQYNLILPKDAKAIIGNAWVNPHWLTSTTSLRVAENNRNLDLGAATKADYWNLLDMDSFLLEGELITAIRWDNNAWQCCVYCGSNSFDLCYVPKGSFCPVIRAQLNPQTEGWAYDTACGEQVYITLDGTMDYPCIETPLVLYQTDSAYVILQSKGSSDAEHMQAYADIIDFTKFK